MQIPLQQIGEGCVALGPALDLLEFPAACAEATARLTELRTSRYKNPARGPLIEQYVAVQLFAHTVNGVLDIGIGAHQIRAQTRTVIYNLFDRIKRQKPLRILLPCEDHKSRR